MNTSLSNSTLFKKFILSFTLVGIILLFFPQSLDAQRGEGRNKGSRERIISNDNKREGAQTYQTEDFTLSWNSLRGYILSDGEQANLLPEDARDALQLLNKGRYAEERGKRRAALKRYKKVFKKYPQSVFAPEAHYRTAQVKLSQGKDIEAFESYYIILRAYPKYGDFDTHLGDAFEIANNLINGKRQPLFWGIPGFPNKNKGINSFELFIQAAPYSDYSALALMKIAKCHVDKRRFVPAIDALDRLINSYPDSLVTSDAYLELAASYLRLVDGPLYDQGSTKEAISYFEDFLALFPNDTNVKKAEDGRDNSKELLAMSKFKIARFYQKKRNYVASQVFYNEAITISPNSKTAEEARERLEIVDQKAAEEEIVRAKKLEQRREQLSRPIEKKKRFLGLF